MRVFRGAILLLSKKLFLPLMSELGQFTVFRVALNKGRRSVTAVQSIPFACMFANIAFTPPTHSKLYVAFTFTLATYISG